ncbi:MAG: hypothetical protein HZB26_01395 [Candidatus Hydrogenedentes bacterium]|nr:hypothetical protein [Candidatus Hydrogenedentota bacterium]
MKYFLCVCAVLSAWPACVSAAGADDSPKVIGFHDATYDASGKLVPWTSMGNAVDLEMEFYLRCPLDAHGYPVFAFTTFMDGEYKVSRMDTIPCTQNGMGILSYLKYWEHKGRTNPKVLDWAKKMGDYLVNETLTPNRGAWPRFTRSTGFYMDFPLFRASQGDVRYGKNVIEPDKGGISGYALLKLYKATGDRRYLKQAVRNADALVKNMRTGTDSQAPWPYRVDSVTGQHWGERSANMVFILRLFDALLEEGYTKYQRPRDALWSWIKTYQIPAPDDPPRNLWVSFFEDYDLENNRNSWAPLETARYLIERKDELDPEWRTDTQKLIQFALKYFSSPRPGGVTVMGEQDDDHDPWGGACSKLGGVAAMFYAAGGGEQYKEMAYRNLAWMTYFIDKDGCPCQKADNKRPSWMPL